tara:strand:- start:3426 stop:4556 length:1131 start_codon:yes stop_codon:yes gene_type:complete
MTVDEIKPARDGRKVLLVDGYYLSSSRGMGRYARELVAALALSPDLDLHVVVQSGELEPLPAGVHRHERPGMPFPLWEQLMVPLVLRTLKPDVFHAPYNTAPVLRMGVPTTVVTIHDLMFLDPEFKTHSIRQRIGRAYRQIFVPRSTSKSLKVTTETNEVSSMLQKRFGMSVHLHRISVEGFVGVNPEPVEGLPGRYILFVSGAAFNKNSERTIAAFRQAAAEDAILIVAGIGAGHASALKHTDETVKFPGWLTDGQLIYLYRNAIAVLFPSLLEGYGLPVLEGMATCGVVVTSDRPPMNELAENAAVLVDPESVDEIAEAIRRVWTDGDLRDDLKVRAAIRMKAFSRAAMSEALCALYLHPNDLHPRHMRKNDVQ